VVDVGRDIEAALDRGIDLYGPFTPDVAHRGGTLPENGLRGPAAGDQVEDVAARGVVGAVVDRGGEAAGLFHTPLPRAVELGGVAAPGRVVAARLVSRPAPATAAGGVRDVRLLEPLLVAALVRRHHDRHLVRLARLDLL